MIELNGAAGEGGGQILRSALTLSVLTGQAFRIRDIRANRSKPGLMRQHLVAVQAAAEVCGAQAEGAHVGSLQLSFSPGAIRGGDYRFAIGTAGSCTLVLQTLVPALLFADRPSTVRVAGGTHNPMAPPAQFLQRAYARALADMGAAVGFELHRFGFYPAGGGAITAMVQPCGVLRPFEWMARGARVAAYAESFVAGISANVARRELDSVGAAMGWEGSQLRERGLPGEQGPGNALLITLEHEHVTEVFTAIGEKSIPSDAVARAVVKDVRRYLASEGAVGEHLADQLMLPMALAGGGRYTTASISLHARTNAQVIERFLPVRFEFGEQGGVHTCLVEAASAYKPPAQRSAVPVK
ncbi:RNA 3'-terminal phosphate cyclase [Massilia terrae]|uniref:RNA 3'-terminal phosphate cyclase n=1 Tax=Massilia terrae TaxID=1811224 RepID=A0ABT2D0T4_9BURK|nr:RNA 3'-terminal phosphate cyclase [Massilia terrae]MCS0659836.1 RNA 3'-terminal phosphate cyclase [Massilia terrae]